ncbi:hypothetical protein MRB53_003552 [Persea americana]|uniref:Uncharacterized protein n=1 Tax=Persea americana TaxID=3435 RepID=A0ACC2MXY9_PERAE|nr:hypothetical protein MRB53_003552 [Persea americana]
MEEEATIASRIARFIRRFFFRFSHTAGPRFRSSVDKKKTRLVFRIVFVSIDKKRKQTKHGSYAILHKHDDDDDISFRQTKPNPLFFVFSFSFFFLSVLPDPSETRTIFERFIKTA